jgi:hypothetical protein
MNAATFTPSAKETRVSAMLAFNKSDFRFGERLGGKYMESLKYQKDMDGGFAQV